MSPVGTKTGLKNTLAQSLLTGHSTRKMQSTLRCLTSRAGALARAGRGMSTLPGSMPLAEHDPELHALVLQERDRQMRGLELVGALCLLVPTLAASNVSAGRC